MKIQFFYNMRGWGREAPALFALPRKLDNKISKDTFLSLYIYIYVHEKLSILTAKKAKFRALLTKKYRPLAVITPLPLPELVCLVK